MDNTRSNFVKNLKKIKLGQKATVSLMPDYF